MTDFAHLQLKNWDYVEPLHKFKFEFFSKKTWQKDLASPCGHYAVVFGYYNAILNSQEIFFRPYIYILFGGPLKL